MSRSAKDLEIPGYYRDPKTGKYFRLPSYGTPHVTDTNTSNNYEASCSINSARNLFHRPSVLRSGNILDCVTNNRNGSSLSHVFQDDILSFKVQDLKALEMDLFTDCNSTLNVRMLKGGDKAFYGQYIKSMNGVSHIYAFENSKKPGNLRREIVSFKQNVTVSDFCEMKIQNSLILMIVGNDFQTGTASAYLQAGVSRPYDIGILQQFILGSAAWCCCSNSFNNDLAIGVENGICVNTIFNNFYFKKLPGQVYSVNFNKKGKVIYAGLNTGHAIITDTRGGANEYDMIKLHNLAINETIILDDENYLMCGGLDNLLCKVDLRMVRVAVNYSGDIRSARKIPISVNETFNLLCSTGIDNITRLWSLSSGKLLRSIYPPVPGPDCRSWLDDDSAKCSLYITQQKKMYFYEF